MQLDQFVVVLPSERKQRRRILKAYREQPPAVTAEAKTIFFKESGWKVDCGKYRCRVADFDVKLPGTVIARLLRISAPRLNCVQVIGLHTQFQSAKLLTGNPRHKPSREVRLRPYPRHTQIVATAL